MRFGVRPLGRVLRQHFNRSGNQKRKFPSRNAALLFLTQTGQAGCFRIYRCKLCGGWHLTKRKARAHG